MLSFVCSLLKPVYLGFLLGCVSSPISGNRMEESSVRAFINEVAAKHSVLSRPTLLKWFEEVEFQEDVIEHISRPYEEKPWHEYWPLFVTEQRAKEGAAFWERHKEALTRAEATYGVSPEILIAILGVETRYGKQTGNYRVLDALATLAFGYPKRAPFFRKELENFLLLLKEEEWSPLLIKGSYAGAIGVPQFMPSSYQKFAVDFDGDGKRDLLRNPVDVIGSVAAYFKAHGWKTGEPVAISATLKSKGANDLTRNNLLAPQYTLTELMQKGVQPNAFGIPENQKVALLELEGINSKGHWLGFHNFYVITRYNRSIHYAMAVYQLSRKISRAYYQKDF